MLTRTEMSRGAMSLAIEAADAPRRKIDKLRPFL